MTTTTKAKATTAKPAATAAPLVDLPELGQVRLDLNAMSAIEDVLGCSLSSWGQRLSDPTQVRLGELRDVLAAALVSTDPAAWGTLDDAKKRVGQLMHLGNVRPIAQAFSQAISDAMGVQEDDDWDRTGADGAEGGAEVRPT